MSLRLSLMIDSHDHLGGPDSRAMTLRVI